MAHSMASETNGLVRPSESLTESRVVDIAEAARRSVDGIWTYEIAAVTVPYDDYPCLSAVAYRYHSCYLPLVLLEQ